MKTFFGFSVVAFALAFAGLTSSAQAFPVAVPAFVTPGRVEAQVCNVSNFYRPMSCTVQVVGYTQFGQPVSNWSNFVLAPGACEFVFTTPFVWGTYFINGQAAANCVWF